MQTRPTHRPAQTIAQAKADYKKHGARMSSQEARQLKRGAELYERAEKIKDKERRRKAMALKRQEKDLKDREGRRRVGLPSQVPPPVDRHQVLLFEFLGNGQNGRTSPKASRWHRSEQLGAATERTCGESLGIEDNKASLEHNGTQVISDEQPLNEEDPWSDQVDDDSLLETIVPASVSTSELLERALLSSKNPPSDRTQSHSQCTAGSLFGRSQGLDCLLDDIHDDLFASSTQIQREISPPRFDSQTQVSTKLTGISAWKDSSTDMVPLSTQDVSLDAEDEVELGLVCTMQKASASQSQNKDKVLMPPPPRPRLPRPTGVHRSTSQRPFVRPAQKPELSYAVKKATDTYLMPPPPRLSFQKRVQSEEYLQFLKTDSQDLLPLDFELSTQDCREIEV